MPSIILSDNGVSSGSAGLKTTAASDGALVLQTTTAGGTATNAVYVDNTQQIGIGTSSPADIVHISSASPRLTFTSTNNTSGARYNTVGTATSGSHRFQYGGTEVLTVGISGQTIALQNGTVSSGTGIAFPATQSASTDANTLDDYEEGTWTPSVSAGSGSITSYTSAGTYVKIGRQVTLNGYLLITDNGTGASYGNIGNFPFTSGNGTQFNTTGIGRNGGTNGYTNNLNMAPNSSGVQCWTYANGYPWATNASLQFSITYFV